jgi:choline dehydrogenase-like flavoprotein
MGGDTIHDAILVGAGISGSWIADALTAAGLRCLMLEAGRSYSRETYPRNELDANSQLYWGGGIELNREATIGLLRPKVVGGGSVVNQALLDRFDDVALDSWREASGVEFLRRDRLDPFYDRAADQISIQTVPEEHRNGNAEVFRRGFELNGYRCAPLERAQRDCRFEDGNCCILCLAGCRIDSKQSTPVTVLGRALERGLELVPQFEVRRVEESGDEVRVTGTRADGTVADYRGRRLVLASGAIGNTRLLVSSDFAERLPALGAGFYTHPQYMTLALYDEPIDAFRGPLQSYKSNDPDFRRGGFKLENVFAPPAAIAMLLPGYGAAHQSLMRKIRHLACIEVAVRDTNPGRIRVTSKGEAIVHKSLNDEDRSRRDRGLEAVYQIFRTTGARRVIEGSLAIGVHLMGGCAIGVDPQSSVVSPEFRLHGCRNIYAADSSIFPNAPGINPSFTIMALSLKAAALIVEEAGR